MQTDWAELSNLRAQSQPTAVYPLTFAAVTMATGKCLSQLFISNFLSILGVSCVQVVKVMDQKFRLESHLSLHGHRALLWEPFLGWKGLEVKVCAFYLTITFISLLKQRHCVILPWRTSVSPHSELQQVSRGLGMWQDW